MHSYGFSQHYYIMDFLPFKTKYNNAVYSKTGIMTCRAKRSVCACVCPCVVINVCETALSSVCADLDEHLCVTFFNNVLSVGALGMVISLTLPKSHNADPLGRENKSSVLEHRGERKAGIMVDAIRRQDWDKSGALNECLHTLPQPCVDHALRNVLLADHVIIYYVHDI